MFVLVDCNNFYASCERVFRPELNNKPVVVLSNNDGCVIARSNEAKQAGIPMGAPAFKYKEVFEQKGIHVFSANFALYGDMSTRVMNILNDLSPDIEIYSIDEAFLKLDGLNPETAEERARAICRKVLKWTGIPISIGIAPTKSLAKVANRVCKKFPEHTGSVYRIKTEEKRIKALMWLKIEDVWGIGRRHAARLTGQGVYNAYDFTLLSDQAVKKQMSVVGLRLKLDLSGIPVLDLEKVQNKKNIATTRSFEQNYTRFDELHERISTFAAVCSEKLRRQGSTCRRLSVFAYTNGHRNDLPQYRPKISMRLPFATNSSIELSEFATSALKKIFKSGYAYKKAGVIVSDLTPENQEQTTLFESSNKKHRTLMNTVDRLNQNLGEGKIKLGSQDLKRTWKMRQEKLSPRYTTRLSDVIKVKC